MKIAIGNDHAGTEIKNIITTHLLRENHDVNDFGTMNNDSCDYPDYAHLVAESIASGTDEIGILICGSGNGVAMTANKHENVRCAIAWNTEIAELSREHNNANIIAIPTRFVDLKDTIEMINIFISTRFEGGRHTKRVDKINV